MKKLKVQKDRDTLIEFLNEIYWNSPESWSGEHARLALKAIGKFPSDTKTKDSKGKSE